MMTMSRLLSRRSGLSAAVFCVCLFALFYTFQPLPLPRSAPYTKPIVHTHTSTEGPAPQFIDLEQHPEIPLVPYNPYAAHDSPSWRSSWDGKIHACDGPQGLGGSVRQAVHARSVPSSVPIPEHNLGSYEELEMDSSYCFARNSEPDGFHSSEAITEHEVIDWEKVDWGTLQNGCIEKNHKRYGQYPDRIAAAPFRMPDQDGDVESPFQLTEEELQPGEPDASHESKLRPRFSFEKKYHTRKAVLIRSWDSKKYNQEVTENIRSMIAQLSLDAGGEYAVYLVVDIKSSSDPINNSTNYRTALDKFVPKEFHNITLLFNQAILDAWYPDMPPGGQRFHMNQPVQLFSFFNPQFYHVWDIELDVRYIGNWYSLFSSATNWARAQPRKLSWERAEKFYIPSHHGTYANFTAAISAANPSGGVWGPLNNTAIPHPLGPSPPLDKDDWTWGVGEDADDIVPSTLIDTSKSQIFIANNITGFPNTTARRALMTTPLKGLSSRLLRAMHDAQVAGLDMRSELFAHTIALAHGFKVASVPIPLFSGNRTNGVGRDKELEEAWDGTGVEVLPDRDVWTQGLYGYLTFWWRVDHFDAWSQELYRRWYGRDRHGKPGKGKERLCLPAMLLHPVKDVIN